MPRDMPRSAQDVMPAGGFSGIFKMDGLPQMLKVSYILWLVSGALGLLFGLIGFVASLALLGSRSFGGLDVVVTLISLVLAAASIICAMKLKEGLQWARMALTAIVVVTFILMFFGGGIGLLGIVAAVFMWLPQSSAWLNSRARGVG